LKRRSHRRNKSWRIFVNVEKETILDRTRKRGFKAANCTEVAQNRVQ